MYPYPDCKMCPTPCVTRGAKGTEIRAKIILDCIYGSSIPSGKISEILEAILNRINEAADTWSIDRPSGGGINNSRGVWFEYILAIIAWNVFASHAKTTTGCILKLPSASVLYFIDLFEPDARTALESGLFRTLQSENIIMTMSNPDFIATEDLEPGVLRHFKTPLSNLSLSSQEILSTAYKRIIEQIRYDGIKFGLSVKTSIRPDRRYQTIYEGNILKALIAHLQVRFWDISSKTGFYVVVEEKISNSDREVFSAPATHSIVDVHAKPVPAVDGLYLIKTTSDFEKCLLKMIDEMYI